MRRRKTCPNCCERSPQHVLMAHQTFGLFSTPRDLYEFVSGVNGDARLLGKIKSDGRITLYAQPNTANPFSRFMAARRGSGSAARLAVLRTLDRVSMRHDVPTVTEGMNGVVDVISKRGHGLKAGSLLANLALLSDAAALATSNFGKSLAVGRFDVPARHGNSCERKALEEFLELNDRMKDERLNDEESKWTLLQRCLGFKVKDKAEMQDCVRSFQEFIRSRLSPDDLRPLNYRQIQRFLDRWAVAQSVSSELKEVPGYEVVNKLVDSLRESGWSVLRDIKLYETASALPRHCKKRLTKIPMSLRHALPSACMPNSRTKRWECGSGTLFYAPPAKTSRPI